MSVTIHDPSTAPPAAPAADPFVCDQVYGPGAGFKDQENVMGNPYPYGECTWLCRQWYAVVQQITIPPNMGNANQWIASAHREGWAVDQDPQVGKIAAWGNQYPPFGHVAIVREVRGPGDYTVLEMNFTYTSDDNAGKVDCRAPDIAPDGFITPSGATVGGGGTTGNSMLDALSPAFGGIAASIERAALYLQADLMTAEERAIALGMMIGGGGIMAGGGVLAALTMAGGGSPRAGWSRVASGASGGDSGPQRAPQGSERYATMTATERAWLRIEERRHAETARAERIERTTRVREELRAQRSERTIAARSAAQESARAAREAEAIRERRRAGARAAAARRRHA